MNILLVFATETEASVVQPFFEGTPVSGSRFEVGYHKVEILICGVGMVASALTMATRLTASRPDLVLHAGISGSYHQSLSIGQPVWIGSECFPEMGKQASNDFITLDQMGFDLAGLPFGNNSLQNPFTGYRFLAEWPVVGGATVNQVTTQHGMAASIHHRFGALTESMEGGSVLAASLLAGTDCLQLRVVSNYCLPSPADEWSPATALRQLGDAVADTLKRL